MRKLATVHRLVVETNDCGEVFVRNQDNPRSCVRIGPEGRGGLIITAHDAQITPWAVRGLPAVRVEGR